MTSAALDSLRAKSRQVHERMLKVVDDLGDEQLGWRPTPTSHSIGFALWHTARTLDNVQSDLRGAPLEWTQGGYPAKWSHPDRGVGTGWDDERAAALALPPKADLLGYCRRVFELVAEGAAAMTDERFAEKVTSKFMSGDSTYGDVLATSVVHDNRHLGEMEYIKGLQGMRGTATT